MKREARAGTRALAVLLLIHALSPVSSAQPPTPQPPPRPAPITDTEPHGEPEETDLGGGRVKIVTRNAAGQIIGETVIDGGQVTIKEIQSAYPDGQAAEVVVIRFELPALPGLPEVVQYDSSGVPQEKARSGADGVVRERWNPESKQWEAAPERERWDPYTGRWEAVPENERFDPKLGGWQRLNPDTGQWEAIPQTLEDILEELTPSPGPIASVDVPGPLQATARRGHAVAAEARGGLHTTIFSTPQGRLRVNAPDDVAAGDTMSGTIYAEPVGKDQRERARNLSELQQYVVDWERQRIPSTDSSPSTGTPFTLAIPAGASTTRLILRDEDGDEVARRDLPVLRQPPLSVGFRFPGVAQQGNPIAIRGPFDGDFTTTNVTVRGEPLPKIAESPRQIVVHNTTAQVGLAACDVTEGSQKVSGEIRTVAIALAAPRLDLLRGEQTTLNVTVTGLEGIREQVPLVLENLSSTIIRMSGGELQRLWIGPSDVQGGTYTTTRTLSSIQTGSFTINGTVIVAADPLKSKTRADLAITKTQETVMPRRGMPRFESGRPLWTLYTITVTNNGRNGAENVVVTDNLPSQMVPMDCVATATQRDERGAGGQGVCGGSGNTRRITFPYLAPGARVTIYLRANVAASAAPGPVTNTAEVSSLTPDPDLSNNRASVTGQIPAPTVTSTPRPTDGPPPPPPPPPTFADLRLTKMAVPTIVKAGDRIRYTIVVRNLGPDTAAAPLILDTLPTETTFVGCTTTRGACKAGMAAGGLVDAVLPDMPNGAMHTLTVDVDVKKDVGPGTAIINDAEVSSVTPDFNPVNSRATAIVWVRAPVPLVVISEFRTRGPRGEQDEFIELYNRSDRRLDLSGWTLAISNGSGATTPLLTMAPGTLLPAHGHLLLSNSEGYRGSVAADQTFTGDIADDGGIALRPLRGIPGDEVGMSNGAAFREGPPLPPVRTNGDSSYERRPGGASGSAVDTDNNRADFQARTPSDPQNLAGSAPGRGQSPAMR